MPKIIGNTNYIHRSCRDFSVYFSHSQLRLGAMIWRCLKASITCIASMLFVAGCATSIPYENNNIPHLPAKPTVLLEGKAGSKVSEDVGEVLTRLLEHKGFPVVHSREQHYDLRVTLDFNYTTNGDTTQYIPATICRDIGLKGNATLYTASNQLLCRDSLKLYPDAPGSIPFPPHDFQRSVNEYAVRRAQNKLMRGYVMAFIAGYPQNKNSSNIHNRKQQHLHDQLWTTAILKDQHYSYKAYLDKYPMGTYAKEAQEKKASFAIIHATEPSLVKYTSDEYEIKFREENGAGAMINPRLIRNTYRQYQYDNQQKGQPVHCVISDLR